MTNLTPPPAPQAQPASPALTSSGPTQPSTPIPGHPRTSAKVIAILTICFGALVLVGTIGAGTVSAIVGAANWQRGADTPGASGQTVSTESVSSSVAVPRVELLDLQVTSSTLSVRFDDVREATLETTGDTADQWTLHTSPDGRELIVSSVERDRVNLWADVDEATLTLPRSLAGIDANFSMDAGMLDVDGEFGAFAATMAAGTLTASGTAHSVTASLSAGDAELDFDGTSDISLQVSAGQLEADFEGTPPTDTALGVSGGYLSVQLPDAAYDVQSRVAAGFLSNDLSTSSSSDHRVNISVSAGVVDVS